MRHPAVPPLGFTAVSDLVKAGEVLISCSNQSGASQDSNQFPVLSRVHHHFRFKAKWSEREANFFSLRCEKKCFFACFTSMRKIEIWSKTKMERSENKTNKKRKTAIIFASKRNEAKRKHKLPSFSLWSEMKWNGSEKLPSFSLQSETDAKFFSFDAKKMFFRLFSHLKRNENEVKRKQNEKEEKQSETKQKYTLY